MWYTGKGDQGKTKAPSSGEVWKDDKIIEAFGNLDELNSALGVISSAFPEISELIEKIQDNVFRISSEIAGYNMGFDQERVKELEKLIENYGNEIGPLKNFVLPGGHLASSFTNLARTICRRAERSVVSIYKDGKANENHVKYLNRLSTLLFVLALWINKKTGYQNVIWRP
nr:cob(I)yrinic acid a,c-diamide adenosyltransferase [Acidianus sp. RZ1]